MDETKVSLKDMIAALRTELAGAQADGKDEPLRFEIESSEIEVKVSVTREAKAKGGVRFWVINAGVEGKEAQETSLTVKLKLNVFDDKVEPASKKKARISGRG